MHKGAVGSRRKRLLQAPQVPAGFMISLLKEQDEVKGIEEMKCQGMWEFLANLVAPVWFQKGSLGRCSNYVKMEVFLDISELHQTLHPFYDSKGQRTMFCLSWGSQTQPLTTGFNSHLQMRHCSASPRVLQIF